MGSHGDVLRKMVIRSTVCIRKVTLTHNLENKLEGGRAGAGKPVGKILQNVQVIDKGSLDKDGGGSGERDEEDRRDVRDGGLGDKLDTGVKMEEGFPSAWQNKWLCHSPR